MSMDQRMLKLILESHILKNKVVLGQLYNGQRLETIGGKLLRVFIYRTVCPLLAGCHNTYTTWINHIIWPSILLSLTHDINLPSFNLWNISAGCVHWEFLSDKRKQGRKYWAMLVKWTVVLKSGIILKTTFFQIFPLNPHGTYGNEKVLLLQAVSPRWFL